MLAATALLAAADSDDAAADEVDVAVAHLQQAHGTFAACGAAVLADRAARRLGDLGVPLAHRRSRARPGAERSATGPESLSTREREVAALVAEGHTNRQIAEELYVSRKTVETHLARIFAKLGVSRRGAMVEALRRR
jgi:DNA-binding NarL/FixJ family response regulator